MNNKISFNNSSNHMANYLNIKNYLKQEASQLFIILEWMRWILEMIIFHLAAVSALMLVKIKPVARQFSNKIDHHSNNSMQTPLLVLHQEQSLKNLRSSSKTKFSWRNKQRRSSAS